MNIMTFLNDKRCRFERVSHEPTYSAQRLAHELHVSGQTVGKTVLLRAGDTGEVRFVVAVLPANRQIDFKRTANVIGSREVHLATELEIAAHCSDCDFGVLPPFGSRYGMETIVDSSLADDEEIWFEGNTYKEAFRMTFRDFRRIEQPRVASFTTNA